MRTISEKLKNWEEIIQKKINNFFKYMSIIFKNVIKKY